MAEKLERLNIHVIQDLLFHLPYRYQDRTRVASIRQLKPGDEVSLDVEVVGTEIKFAKRRMLLCHVKDDTGLLSLRFFNFSTNQQAGLAEGTRLQVFGEVRWSKSGLEIIHPEYKRTATAEALKLEKFLTAIYPTTEGVSQHLIRNLVDQLFSEFNELKVSLPEYLPEELRQKINLPKLTEAIITAHRPCPNLSFEKLDDGSNPLQQRLAFEELLAQHLALRRLRQLSKRHAAHAIKSSYQLKNKLVDSLAFDLTQAQLRVIKEIENDFSQPHPMQRLIQGDVGSGKTIVAAAAALTVIESGFQVAIMAPTEILAQQHYQSFQNWLQPLSISATWLSGKVKGKARESALRDIEQGTAKLIVGTQALFQDGVEFHSLGLVIVDEQHRFGVHQRLALRDKGSVSVSVAENNFLENDKHVNESYAAVSVEVRHPHQLIMTATPIPRTLAMTAYADLDCSVIDELPPGRKPIDTALIGDERRTEVMQRVHVNCRKGRQAYWVCTLIEESEALQCQTAQDTAAVLQQAFDDVNIGLIHGRMKAAEKDHIMQQFKQGDIQLLVATTVIEVGVDVPNATLMIIENAERLGLSQLHQLRGRVGRGAEQSACVLMYQTPLSDTAKSRLRTMRETTDGFVVAEKDLELRGPGEFLGTRQTGLVNFRIADVVRDQHLVPMVSKSAEWLFKHHPECISPIIQRWLGRKEKFAEV